MNEDKAELEKSCTYLPKRRQRPRSFRSPRGRQMPGAVPIDVARSVAMEVAQIVTQAILDVAPDEEIHSARKRFKLDIKPRFIERQEERARAEEPVQWVSSKPRMEWPWSLQLCIGAVVCLAFFSIGYVSRILPVETNSVAAVVKKESTDMVPIPEKTAHQAARDYLRTASVQERAYHVLRPIDTLIKMQSYYGETELSPIRDARLVEHGSVILSPSKTRYDVFGYDGPQGPQILFVATIPEGFAVNWEASNAYNPISLTRFMEEKGPAKEGSVFRVIAQPDNYYNHDFEEDEFHCLRVWERGDTQHYFAYARLADDSEPVLEGLFPGNQRRMLMLELRRSAHFNTDSRQCEIVGIASESWLYEPVEANMNL